MAYFLRDATFVSGVGWVFYEIEDGIESGQVVEPIRDGESLQSDTRLREMTAAERELVRRGGDGREAEWTGKSDRKIEEDAEVETEAEGKKRKSTMTTTTETTKKTTAATATSGQRPAKRAKLEDCESIKEPDEYRHADSFDYLQLPLDVNFDEIVKKTMPPWLAILQTTIRKLSQDMIWRAHGLHSYSFTSLPPIDE